MPTLVKSETSEELALDADAWPQPKAWRNLRLSTDGWDRTDPPWWLVEITLNTCIGHTPAGIGEYCVLAQTERNTYVQTAYGWNNKEHVWRLEWRVTADDGSYVHYYATEDSNDSRQKQAVNSLTFVTDTFLDFFEGRGLPDKLEWHVMDI